MHNFDLHTSTHISRIRKHPWTYVRKVPRMLTPIIKSYLEGKGAIEHIILYSAHRVIHTYTKSRTSTVEPR